MKAAGPSDARSRDGNRAVRAPSVGLWLGALAVTVVGVFFGFMGALGALFELEPPPTYDVAEPPEYSSYEPMRAVNAICRLDELERVDGEDDSCLLPLAASDAPFDGFAAAPLLLKIDCRELADLVGPDTLRAGRPAPCAPLGKSYGLDVHDETFRQSVNARYPGFVGEVMEPPSAEDLQDAEDTRIIFLGFLGIGATGALGGAWVLVLLWRRRQRAAAG